MSYGANTVRFGSVANMAASGPRVTIIGNNNYLPCGCQGSCRCRPRGCQCRGPCRCNLNMSCGSFIRFCKPCPGACLGRSFRVEVQTDFPLSRKGYKYQLWLNDTCLGTYYKCTANVRNCATWCGPATLKANILDCNGRSTAHTACVQVNLNGGGGGGHDSCSSSSSSSSCSSSSSSSSSCSSSSSSSSSCSSSSSSSCCSSSSCSSSSCSSDSDCDDRRVRQLGPKNVKKRSGEKKVVKKAAKKDDDDEDLGIVVNGLKASSISARTVLPPNMRDEEEPEKEKENVEVKAEKKSKKEEKKGEKEEPWPKPSCDKTITVCRKNAKINSDVSTVIVKSGSNKCRCKDACRCRIKLCLPKGDKCPENYYQASEKSRKKWVCDPYQSESSDDECGCKKSNCKKCWTQECVQVKRRTRCVKRNKNVDQYEGQRLLVKNCSDLPVHIIPHKKDKIRTCTEKLCKFILDPYESAVLVAAGRYWYLTGK